MATRRDFLKGAAIVAGSAGAFGSFATPILRALSIDPEPGSTWMDADHVVILMQENRSFDHCFGTLRGVRGFNDPRAIELSNGNAVWLQTNKAGETYAPFRLNIKDTRATWMGCLPHARNYQVGSWNGGGHDKWLEYRRPYMKQYKDVPMTLGYYTREDLPFYYALADAFTVCDQNFCGVMTESFPNRAMYWSGTIRERQDDRAKVKISNDDVVYNSSHLPYGACHWKTFPEYLQEKGISWRFYQNEVIFFGGMTEEEEVWVGNMHCNPLQYFSQYNIELTPAYVRRIPEEIQALSAKIEKMRRQPPSPSMQKQQRRNAELRKMATALSALKANLHIWQGGFERLSPLAKELHGRAFTTNIGDPDYRKLEMLSYQDGTVERQIQVSKGDLFYQFRRDVQNGELPAVSWLMGPERFSDHPSSPWYGEWYVSEVMNILTQNPDVWKKTIFLITYDENDGYFDHVPPFVATDPRRTSAGHSSRGIDTGLEFYTKEQQDELSVAGPIGLGFRVPLIVASPWSRGGRVNSQVSDHTSTLQFLEQFARHRFHKEIRASNISAWRRTVCGDLTSVFRQYQNGQDKLPFIKRYPLIEAIYNAKFKPVPGDYRRLGAAEIEKMNRDHRLDPQFAEQEVGQRPSCALPYELYAESTLSSDCKNVTVRLVAANAIFGDGAKGSPFIIFAYHCSKDRVPTNAEHSDTFNFSSYAVTAGDTLHDSWPLDAFTGQAYRLCVHGPNGFFREFCGNTDDPRIAISCVYEKLSTNAQRLTGNVGVKAVLPTSRTHYVLSVTDHAYGAAPIRRKLSSGYNSTILLNLEKSADWYDFSVRVDGFPHFERRYAGHVETGKSSYSDPAIGRKRI